LEDFFSAREARLFPVLNRPEHGHVLEAFLQGFPQEVVAFFEDFHDGVFQQDFEAAFFDSSHAQKLGVSVAQVKRAGRMAGPTARGGTCRAGAVGVARSDKLYPADD
jgi:hypothetical protein